MMRMACALVLASSLGLLTGLAPRAEAGQTRAASGLQLSVIAPDPGSIGDRMSLDVSFRGGVVDTVEMYLDNALVAKRQLNTSQKSGIITFTLETMLLTEGLHDVTIRAYGTDGKASVTSTKIRIPAADLSAPVRIVYPQNGFQISGVVPIRVHLDAQLQKQKPYVTFFVDKELKVLRNFPPYEYNWDTTQVPNGWHLLEAWTQAPEAIAPLKARPVHVNVNNVSGETKKQEKIEDLRSKPNTGITLPMEKPRSTTPSAADPSPISRSTPERTTRAASPTASGARVAEPTYGRLRTLGVRPPITGTSRVTPDVVEHKPVQTAGNPRPQSGPSEIRSAEPSRYGYATSSLPNRSAESLLAARPRLTGPSPKMMGGAAVQPQGRIAVASRPQNTLPPLGEPHSIFAVVPPVRSGGSTVTVQPGDTLQTIGRKFGVKPQEIARLNNLPENARLRQGRSLIVPNAGAFDVAFDGSRIHFDVPTRIENGIRLAPFRHIFEHTGGKVEWFGGSAQTVLAINSTREIEIKIGNPQARVNNQIITMERKPYLDSGRTIVPLTFIRDALDVNIHFDAKTGHLLIESRK